MDTISTLQIYGSTPGFHHGVDLQAPAGTKVYAPVGGTIAVGYYYPRYRTPYTYMVSITAKDGYRWELHHVDPDSIPQSVRDLAASGGTAPQGMQLAAIYDASALGIPPHLHVDVIDPQGVYHNGLAFFPALADDRPPTIRGVYFVDAASRAAAAGRLQGQGVDVPAGKYDLVIDAADEIPPGTWGDSLYALEVVAAERPVGSMRFDRLPDKDYLKGVDAVYRLAPFTGPSGETIANQIELDRPRHFLFHFPFDTAALPPGATRVPLEVRAVDFAGNETRLTLELRLQPRAFP